MLTEKPIEYDAWLHWSVTENCNLQCEYCFSPRTNSAKAPVIKIDKLMATLDATGKTFKITFTGGGEPFVVSNFVEASMRITEKHFLGVNTNLTLPRVRKFAESIDPSRVDYVHASCHILELERTGLVSQFIEHFQLLTEKGFVVYASEVAHPTLLPFVDQHREHFRSQGIELQYSPFIGYFDGRKYPESYSADERATFFRSPQPPVRMFRRQDVRKEYARPELMIGNHDPGDVKNRACNAGFNACVVHGNGVVDRCFIINQQLGDVYSHFKFDDDMYICPVDYCGCPLRSYDLYLYDKATKTYIQNRED